MLYIWLIQLKLFLRSILVSADNNESNFSSLQAWSMHFSLCLCDLKIIFINSDKIIRRVRLKIPSPISIVPGWMPERYRIAQCFVFSRLPTRYRLSTEEYISNSMYAYISNCEQCNETIYIYISRTNLGLNTV